MCECVCGKGKWYIFDKSDKMRNLSEKVNKPDSDNISSEEVFLK